MSATIAGGVAILVDVWVTATYNYQENSRATRLEDIHPFFWRMRVYRLISLAFIDGLVGWLLYLSSTNRAFITPRSPAERIESSTRLLENVRSKMNAMSILRNTVNRDEELRDKHRDYWVTEGNLMGELMEEREVIEGINNALENRIDMRIISADAETYAQNVLAPLQAMQDSVNT